MLWLQWAPSEELADSSLVNLAFSSPPRPTNDNAGPRPPQNITALSFRTVHDKAYMPHESPWGGSLGAGSGFEDRVGYVNHHDGVIVAF
jgi:hypothetical protein